MTLILGILATLQVFAVSLGVGSSTLAILNFFSAIADGEIDETERRMMGIVYVVLRVAMFAILITTAGLLALAIEGSESILLTTSLVSQFILIGVLFVNAIFMTAHIVPSTIGPGLQAGTWYSLGAVMALQSIGIATYTLGQFFLAYVTMLVFAIGLVNAVMAILKTRTAT